MTLDQILQDAGIQSWGPILGIVLMVLGFISLLFPATAGCSKCG
jgi:hypothetical protein